MVSCKRFVFILNTKQDAQTGACGASGARAGPGFKTKAVSRGPPALATPPALGPGDPAPRGRRGGARRRRAAPHLSHLPARPGSALPSSVRPPAPPWAGTPPPRGGAPRRPQGDARRLRAGLNRRRGRAELAPKRGPASRARAHRPSPAPPGVRAARTGARRPAPCYLPEMAGGGRGSWLWSLFRPLMTPITLASPVRLQPLHPQSSGVWSLRHHRDWSGSRTECQPAALRRHHRGSRTRNRARAAA